MIKEFFQKFIQTSFFSLIWLMIITSYSNIHTTVSFNYFWKLMLIAMLYGFTFGVIYPYLWNYATTSATANILITSGENTVLILLSVYLYSEKLFTLMFPYFYLILILNLIFHYLVFKIYSDFMNRKLINELEN